jgi:hypothetical protein
MVRPYVLQALRGESITGEKQAEQVGTKNRRKLFIIFNILDLLTLSDICLEVSPGVYQPFNELFIISILYRVLFDGHTAGACPSQDKYAAACGDVFCASPNICDLTKKCVPSTSCMSQCSSSFKNGAFASISTTGTAVPNNLYTAFPSSKKLNAFGVSMTGFSVESSVGGNPTLKLYRTATDSAPAVLWSLLDQAPLSGGTVYTSYDGDDLFTISWEGWLTPLAPQDAINSQITLRFSTGDYLLCYGSGTLTQVGGCPASGFEKAFLSWRPSQSSSLVCFPTFPPFNTASSCAADELPGNGRSWTWPGANYCVCGNLK